MEFKVNINEKVKVKLTDRGITLLKSRREELNKAVEKFGIEGFGEFEPEKDADGYTTFQLWELMDIFGDDLSTGFETPFETEIIVTKGKLT